MKRPEDMTRQELEAEVRRHRGRGNPRGLRPTEAAILAVLQEAEFSLTPAQIMSKVACDAGRNRDYDGLFKVHLSNIRKQLGFNAVENIRPGRYRLTIVGRHILNEPVAA